MTRISSILVPTDFSNTADAALDYAFVIAERFGAAVHLLHVIEDPFVAGGLAGEAYVAEAPSMRAALMNDAQSRLAQRAVPRHPGGTVDSEVMFGHGARTIAEFARERGIDMIVMGTHGRTGIAHLVLGSVTERLVRIAPCPVLTVRHPKARAHHTELVYDVEHLPA